MAVLYLARHGRTAYNHERRFQGQLPVALDEVGLEQARELAERAAQLGFAALWSSPLRRARETADIVAERIGVEPRDDPRLMETDSGSWTDRTFAEVLDEAPTLFTRFVALDPTFAFPGGESFAAQSARVHEALADIRRGPLPALAVCHGVVIRLALSARQATGNTPPRIENAALVPLGD
ncbi:MAG: histidine phosphatase family protein [Solirubrobacteraceae bacterium]